MLVLGVSIEVCEAHDDVTPRAGDPPVPCPGGITIAVRTHVAGMWGPHARIVDPGADAREGDNLGKSWA